MEKILVIKHGALGDFILMTGMMRAIREKHSHARISLITQGWIKPLAEKTGWFDEVICDSRRYNLREWWRICVQTIGGREWDYIYDLQANNRTLCRYRPIALFFTRYALNWGRRRKDGTCGFIFMKTPRKLPLTWKTATYEEVLMQSYPIDLGFLHGDGANFALLPEKYILLAPGCSAKNPQKRWPAEHYRAVSKHFGELGIKSVVMGTKAEKDDIEAICEGNPYAINFMGKSSIMDIPDMANRAQVVIGNDSGPTHIAHWAGARTICLLLTCYRHCGTEGKHIVNFDAERLVEISPEQVIAAAETLIKKES